MEIEPLFPLVIKIFPEHGHPSSLWPSPELVKAKTRNPYIFPSEIGIKHSVGERIIRWSDDFQNNFIEYGTTFDERPTWNESFNVWAWYTEGYRIVEVLDSEFPDVYIKPGFSRYVFSANEIRQNAGLPPIQLPGMNRPGHIDISTVSRPSP